DSAGMNMVIHCLPGPATRKALAIHNVAAVLSPNGTLFGATILARAPQHSWLGHRVLTAFNRRGAFDNLDDTADGLREMLAANFEKVDVQIVGCAPRVPGKRTRAV